MNVITLLTPKAQVAYLYDDYTIRQGLEKMRSKGYTALPVLSRAGAYVGTVNEGDFLWAMLRREGCSLQDLERESLDSILRFGFNPAVSVRVTMEELLEQSTQQNFVPVVDDRGAFVGIVTRKSILRKLALPNIKTETAAVV